MFFTNTLLCFRLYVVPNLGVFIGTLRLFQQRLWNHSWLSLTVTPRRFSAGFEPANPAVSLTHCVSSTCLWHKICVCVLQTWVSFFATSSCFSAVYVAPNLAVFYWHIKSFPSGIWATTPGWFVLTHCSVSICLWHQPWAFFTNLSPLLQWFWATKCGCFRSEHDPFWTITKCFLCLYLTTASPQCCWEIKLQHIHHKIMYKCKISIFSGHWLLILGAVFG